MKTLKSLLLEAEKIKGGKAAGMNPSDFDQKQLMKGIYVELEHTKDIEIATEIAMDHLEEDPNYYIKLSKVHQEMIKIGRDGETEGQKTNLQINWNRLWKGRQ